MLKNLVTRIPVEIVEHTIEFTYEDGNGGYSFAADEHGVVQITNEDQRRNYEYAMAHPELFPEQYNEHCVRRRTYMEPAHGKCHCGEEVYLNNEYLGACQCPNCGQWYNLYGQELIEPEYWGE